MLSQHHYDVNHQHNKLYQLDHQKLGMLLSSHQNQQLDLQFETQMSLSMN